MENKFETKFNEVEFQTVPIGGYFSQVEENGRISGYKKKSANGFNGGTGVEVFTREIKEFYATDIVRVMQDSKYVLNS